MSYRLQRLITAKRLKPYRKEQQLIQTKEREFTATRVQKGDKTLHCVLLPFVKVKIVCMKHRQLLFLHFQSLKEVSNYF